VADGLGDAIDVGVAPPHVHLSIVADELTKTKVALSGQDCAAEKDGAFTGDVSAEMLADVGCRFAIVGHSERRQHRAETDALVAKKVEAALRAGLVPILCVGERLDERDAGRHETVCAAQLEAVLASPAALDAFKRNKVVVAYEPVWAIGTGRVATPEQAGAMHRLVRQVVAARAGDEAAKKLTILYGGSVKPDNAPALAATDGVDGALVGGASLDAGQFLAIVSAFGQAARKQSRELKELGKTS
jgi:triosephosphate isomerase